MTPSEIDKMPASAQLRWRRPQAGRAELDCNNFPAATTSPPQQPPRRNNLLAATTSSPQQPRRRNNLLAATTSSPQQPPRRNNLVTATAR
jgi:hypothetical protein